MKITNGFSQDVALGKIYNTTSINKFGIGTVTTNWTTITANNSGLMNYPDDELLYVVSTSTLDIDGGTGAHSVTLKGLDADFLPIEEVVVLNGTTSVASTKKYSRIPRAWVEDVGSGETAAGQITIENSAGTTIFNTILVDDNQTEMAAFTIPAGYTGLLEQIVVTRYDITKDANYRLSTRDISEDNKPFRTKENIYGSNSIMVRKFDPPMKIDELTDMEMRGIVSVSTDSVTAAFDMELIKDKDTVGTFTTTLSTSVDDSEVTLSWTAATTDHFDSYKVTIDGVASFYPKGTLSHIFTGLINDQEYDFTVSIVTADEESAIFSTSATPAVPIVSSGFVLTTVTSMAGSIVPSEYYFSDDSGDTWTSKNAITTLGFNGAAVLDDKVIVLFNDPDSVLDSQIGTTTDGTTWTYDTSESWVNVEQFGDRVFRSGDITTSTSADGVTWEAITGTFGSDSLAWDGTNYVGSSGGNVYHNTTGYGAFSTMANTPGTWDFMLGGNGVFISGDPSSGTTIVYKTTNDLGATAWSAGGTSTISMTAGSIQSTMSFEGKVFVAAWEDDYSDFYMEYSANNGASFTSLAVPGTAGSLPMKFGTDGTYLYLITTYSNDGFSTFTNYISRWNGTSFGTPVEVNTGTGNLLGDVGGTS